MSVSSKNEKNGNNTSSNSQFGEIIKEQEIKDSNINYQ